jgi:hypothetical protein
MVCYSSKHYDIGNNGDLEALLAVAANVAARYFGLLPTDPEEEVPPHDLAKKPRAFWIAANCMPCNEVTDENGISRMVEGLEQERLGNQDVSLAQLSSSSVSFLP